MNSLKKKNDPLLTDDDLKAENIKARITTYIDLDILDALKKMARNKRTGYQTMLNEVLRDSLFRTQDIEKRLSRVERKLKLVEP